MPSNFSPRNGKDPLVTAIILAGGQGTRLFPLTSSRCKPAVAFGGRYRIIDVAISNAINAKIENTYIISQFLASSLTNYLLEAYPNDKSNRYHIEILSPEETLEKKVWYEGTADAIRQNLDHLLQNPVEYFVILSGDQLYNMNLNELVDWAIRTDSDLTIATLPVEEKEAKRMGVMKIDEQFAITDFYEKPQEENILKRFLVPDHVARKHSSMGEPCYLGSMGIYVFKKEALIKLLREDPRADFGKHLIPTQVQNGKTSAFIFNGYWEDIGTVSSFYEANMRLTSSDACLDLYDEKSPVFAATQHLPSARIKNTRMSDSIICDGSIIEAEEIKGSTIGIRSQIHEGTRITDSIIMGNQRYQSKDKSLSFSIGKNCVINKAIIDEHCRIGNHVELTNTKKLDHFDGEGVFIRDGIIIVTAGTHLPDNYTL